MPQALKYQKLPLKDSINQKLVDCLPGIFYLYEISETGYKIKGWNKNHELVTGYTAEEMMDKPPYFFVDSKSEGAIADAIQYIIDTGYVNRVYGNILSKSGELIPHVFEGYKFNVGDREYFMGLGINVTELVHAKERLRFLSLEKRKKEKELLSISLQEQKKEQLLHTVLNELVTIRENGLDEGSLNVIQSLTREIQTHFSFQNNWQHFSKLFSDIHHSFFTNLESKHPDLTQSEIQYCAYVKIHFNSEQICDILNITRDGLIKKRYRLKKKFGLEKGKKIDLYIRSF